MRHGSDVDHRQEMSSGERLAARTQAARDSGVALKARTTPTALVDRLLHHVTGVCNVVVGISPHDQPRRPARAGVAHRQWRGGSGGRAPIAGRPAVSELHGPTRGHTAHSFIVGLEFIPTGSRPPEPPFASSPLSVGERGAQLGLSARRAPLDNRAATRPVRRPQFEPYARASAVSAGSSSGGPSAGSTSPRRIVASRSEPAMMSSGALSLGRKPDFMPK